MIPEEPYGLLQCERCGRWGHPDEFTVNLTPDVCNECMCKIMRDDLSRHFDE